MIEKVGTLMITNSEQHPFEVYVNEESFKNPALLKAWQEYAAFILQAEFSDVSMDEKQNNGMTLDEVNDHFKASVPAHHHAFQNREESLKYIYQSEELMPKSENAYMATIYFHFLDRRLYYAEIRIQVDSDLEKDFISAAEKSQLLADHASIEKLAELRPQTFGLAQMKMDGQMSYELFVPYVADDGVEYAEFFMIRDGQIQLGYTTTLAKEFQSNKNTLMRNLLAFEQMLKREKANNQLADHTDGLDHPFDDYVSSYTFENPASRLAFQNYKVIYHDFGLANFDLSDLKGVSPSELASQFKGQDDPTHIISSEEEEYLIYLFKSELINPQTGKERQAELKLYFYNKVLVYADIFGLDSYFYENELLDFDTALKELPKGTTLDKFIDMEPITMGLGQFVYENDNYTIIMTPQMSQEDQMVIVNYVFVQDVMHYAFASNYSDVKDNIRNAMTQTFMSLTREAL